MIYLDQIINLWASDSKFSHRTIEDRPIRVLIEHENSLTFWARNDFFWIEIGHYILDTTSWPNFWIQNITKVHRFHQSISESSDENSSAQKSPTLTFGQIFQNKTFSNIKILQMIHHDHKKSKNLEKSTKSQNFYNLEKFLSVEISYFFQTSSHFFT